MLTRMQSWHVKISSVWKKYTKTSSINREICTCIGDQTGIFFAVHQESRWVRGLHARVFMGRVSVDFCLNSYFAYSINNHTSSRHGWPRQHLLLSMAGFLAACVARLAFLSILQLNYEICCFPRFHSKTVQLQFIRCWRFFFFFSSLLLLLLLLLFGFSFFVGNFTYMPLRLRTKAY